MIGLHNYMTVFSSNSPNIKLRNFKNFPHFWFVFTNSSTLNNVQKYNRKHDK